MPVIQGKQQAIRAGATAANKLMGALIVKALGEVQKAARAATKPKK